MAIIVDAGYSSQVAMLTPAAEQTFARASQVAMMVIGEPPFAFKAKSTQQVMMTPAVEQAFPRSSQVAMLVVAREGPIERYTSRAWTFHLDGHNFYVLHLGLQGTYVYDQLTGRWAQWQTVSTAPLWNMEHGITWNGISLAGDNNNSIIWQVDPDVDTDEGYRTITRKVTSLVPVRRREFVDCFGLYLTASTGFPASVDAELSMRWSDDGGNTWETADTITLTDETDQELAWRSLGQMSAPGRIFEFTDAGGLVRISGADIETGAEDG